MATETKVSHTPGPWETALTNTPRQGYAIDIGVDEDSIGAVYGQDALSEANARLIAAAPELLAALDAVIGYAEVVEEQLAGEGGTVEQRCVDALAAARTAIAKARGEACH